MDFYERRAWDVYWQLPGRDYQQVDMAAAAPDCDPDIDEGFHHVGGERVDRVAGAAGDVAGEPVYDGGRAEDELKADSLRQANAREDVDPATNVEHPDQDDDADRDSGYETASLFDSLKQQASTLAFQEHHGIRRTSSPDSIDPVDSTTPANKLSALPAASDQDAATMSLVFDSGPISSPTFEPSSDSRTTPPSSPARDNFATSSDPPLFHENEFGSLDNDSTIEDASQDIPVWRHGTRSVLERLILVDTTINDGLVCRGRDASYPNHKWMGSVVQEARRC